MAIRVHVYRNEPRWKKAIREEWIEIVPNWFVRQAPDRNWPWWRQAGHRCGSVNKDGIAMDARVRSIIKYGKKDHYSKCHKCGTKVPENVWLWCYLWKL